MFRTWMHFPFVEGLLLTNPNMKPMNLNPPPTQSLLQSFQCKLKHMSLGDPRQESPSPGSSHASSARKPTKPWAAKARQRFHQHRRHYHLGLKPQPPSHLEMTAKKGGPWWLAKSWENALLICWISKPVFVLVYLLNIRTCACVCVILDSRF